MITTRRGWLLGIGLAGAAIALSSCDVGPELALTVTTTADGVDAAPGDGVCEVTTGPGDCSLRAAIQEANAFTASDAGHTTITLAPGTTHTLGLAGTLENAGATGDLDVTGDLTVVGHGASVDADDLDRVVHVLAGGILHLEDVTITGGSANLGGGVRVDEGATASIERSTISGNESTDFASCHYTTLIPQFLGCSSETVSAGGVLSSRTGEGGGGGLWNRGDLTVLDSTISGNTTSGRGGCLAWFRYENICAHHAGGGLLNHATANLVNVTISGNDAIDGYGAGVATGWEGSTTMVHTTIADNTVTLVSYGTADGPDVLSLGDGHAMAGGPTRIGHSVLAGEGPLCSAPDAQYPSLPPAGPSSSLGHNLFEDATCLVGVSVGTDQIAVAAGLSPLAANGGPTQTHLPGPNLVDTIPVGELLCGSLPDQRGTVRPQGSACDIGAVERTLADP